MRIVLETRRSVAEAAPELVLFAALGRRMPLFRFWF